MKKDSVTEEPLYNAKILEEAADLRRTEKLSWRGIATVLNARYKYKIKLHDGTLAEHVLGVYPELRKHNKKV